MSHNYVIGDRESLQAALVRKQRVQAAVAQGAVLSPTLSSDMTGNVYVFPNGSTVNVRTGETTAPNNPPPVVNPGAGGAGGSNNTMMLVGAAAVVGVLFFVMSNKKKSKD